MCVEVACGLQFQYFSSGAKVKLNLGGLLLFTMIKKLGNYHIKMFEGK